MTGMAEVTHWDSVYGARDEDALTWFEDVPDPSLSLIRDLARPDEPVIGDGALRLVNHLLAAGYGDIPHWQPATSAYALWHDRAAFHFLTEDKQRAAYVARMAAAPRPGSQSSAG